MEPKDKKSGIRTSHRPHIRESVWRKVVEVANEEGIRPNRLIEDALEDYLKALGEAQEIDRRNDKRNESP